MPQRTAGEAAVADVEAMLAADRWRPVDLSPTDLSVEFPVEPTERERPKPLEESDSLMCGTRVAGKTHFLHVLVTAGQTPTVLFGGPQVDVRHLHAELAEYTKTLGGELGELVVEDDHAWMQAEVRKGGLHSSVRTVVNETSVSTLSLETVSWIPDDLHSRLCSRYYSTLAWPGKRPASVARDRTAPTRT